MIRRIRREIKNDPEDPEGNKNDPEDPECLIINAISKYEWRN